jgi:hypothetical protein
MDCNSSRCEYSIFHQKGCRDPGCIKVRPLPCPASFRLCPQPSILNSITALKYKKSSTLSTMTALHVVPPPPVHLHVDASSSTVVVVLRLHSCPRARSIPPSPSAPPESNSIISSTCRSTPRRHLCCPNRPPTWFVLTSRRHNYIPDARTPTPVHVYRSHTPCALLYYHPCLHCSYIMTPATSHTSLFSKNRCSPSTTTYLQHTLPTTTPCP